MARRASDSTESEGSRRTRFSVAVPISLVNLIPPGTNKSALVSKLLEDNIGRFSSIPPEEIRALRKKKAKKMVLKEIGDMSRKIAVEAANEDTKVFSHTLMKIDERIVDLRDIQRQLEVIREELIYVKKDRFDHIKQTVEDAIRGTLHEMELTDSIEPPKRKEKKEIEKQIEEEKIAEILDVRDTQNTAIIVASPTQVDSSSLPIELDKEVTIVPGLTFTRTK